MYLFKYSFNPYIIISFNRYRCQTHFRMFPDQVITADCALVRSLHKKMSFSDIKIRKKEWELRQLAPRLVRINLVERFNNSFDVLVDWWNAFIDNGFHERMKAVYLWGKTFTGKTHFVENVLFRYLNRAYHVWSPNQHDGRHAFSNFDRANHHARKLFFSFI